MADGATAMQHSLRKKLFFLGNDREVNRLVLRIGGIFMAVLASILAAAHFGIFRVASRDVLFIMGLLCGVEALFYLLLKLNAPITFVKYYGLLAMEFCLMVMSSNAYFGIYITYILVPAISCLYFDKKLTRNITVLCYFAMLCALWVRAPGAIKLAYPCYTQQRWFIAFGLGYTMEYVALSAVLIAVSNRTRRYMEELHLRSEKISDIRTKIIYRFADLVESRDDNTGKHVKRTSRYVVMIANRLRQGGPYASLLNDTAVVNLELAAPLHDIGKIVIPDAILHKPGKLTPEEFSIIQTHTTEGEKIIASSMSGIESEEFLSVARDIALSHHEKWDGTGYPNGLSGTNISLPARIMAVADVFDALVSDRCYKQPVSIEDAFEIMQQARGSHFDPYLVDVFIASEAEIRSIMAEQ